MRMGREFAEEKRAAVDQAKVSGFQKGFEEVHGCALDAAPKDEQVKVIRSLLRNDVMPTAIASGVAFSHEEILEMYYQLHKEDERRFADIIKISTRRNKQEQVIKRLAAWGYDIETMSRATGWAQKDVEAFLREQKDKI